ncbi:MAG: hypothetical protein QXW88_07655, partial [Thermofilum sp.]
NRRAAAIPHLRGGQAFALLRQRLCAKSFMPAENNLRLVGLLSVGAGQEPRAKSRVVAWLEAEQS